MPIITGAGYQDKYNRPLYGNHGQYTLSKSVPLLPYFLCAMPIDRAIDELVTSEQIPPSLDNRWSISELVQRELDRDRIENDLVRGYLGDPHKVVFFNALTVVLMPKADGVVSDAFGENSAPPPIPWQAGDEDDAQWSTGVLRDFGGVQYVTYGQQARLRWDSNSVLPLVVDGQHRLEGLRGFREALRHGTLKPDEADTYVPVLFVLLAEEAGFKPNVERDIRGVSRELFTDLNKNARSVDKARELILDDFSIIPRCVRTLVTDEAARDSKDQIPLSLIRWQEDNARFDSAYYLNSLINLESLVSLILALKIPSDPMDQEEVSRYIQSIDDSLGTRESGGARRLSNDKKSLSDTYKSEFVDTDGEAIAPFSRIPTSYMASAVKNFELLHRPWLLRLLMGLKPYRELLDYARSGDLIEGPFGQFFAQTKGHRALLIQELRIEKGEGWYTDTIEGPRTAIEQMKGAGDTAQWSFKSVFQRAVVRLGKAIAFEHAGDPILGDMDDLISLLDRLYDKDVLMVGAELPSGPFGVWDILAINPGGGTIKVSKRTEDRILALLRLWYYQDRMLSADPTKSAAEVLKVLEATKNQAQWPACASAVTELTQAFTSFTFFNKNPAELSEKSQRAQISEHLRSLLEAGKAPLEPEKSEG